MKRATITWVPITEGTPAESGKYLITVKAWPQSDPFHIEPWDGKTAEVGLDRFVVIPYYNEAGQWFTVNDGDVLAWARFPKPYEREDRKK